jgi:DNA-binding CsgD family transcriptional regulator
VGQFKCVELLERAGELRVIDEAIADARAGAGGALLIEGPAGIGKTRLLRAVAARARRAKMAVLGSRGSELEGGFAWGVVRQLFERHVSELDGAMRAALFAGAAALAAPALGLSDGSGGDADASFATLHGLYWLMANAVRGGPAVIAVDDVQWSDMPSLRFLAFLMVRLEGLPLLVAMTARTGGPASPEAAELIDRIGSDADVRRLRPAPLSRGASARFVRSQLGDEAADEFCAACHTTTGGNPFLLHELVGELASEEVAPTAAAAEQVSGTTPEVVRRSVLLRLARMSTDAVALSRAVAVLGPQADMRHVADLADLDEAAATAAARAAIAADILEDGPTLAFVHPILRAAVLGDLSVPERARWHERAARLLAGDGSAADDVARHLVFAPAAGDEWVVRALREGAARASGGGAGDVAATYLRRALAEPPADDDRVDVLAELAAAEVADDVQGACAHLEEAMALLAPGPRHAELALALGRALALAGRFADAADLLEAAIGELGEDASQLARTLQAEFVNMARWELSTRPRSFPVIDRLRERALAGEALDPRLETQVAIELAVEGRELAPALAHARAALAGVELMAAESSSNVPQAVSVVLCADAVDEASRHAEALLRTAEQQGWPMVSAIAASACALVSLHRGAVSDAIAYARQSLPEGSEGWAPPMGVAFLAGALIARGELEDAGAEYARRGWDGELPPVWPFTVACFFRGQLRAARGEHERAVADLLLTGELCTRWGVLNPAFVWWRSCASASLVALDRHREALDLAREELELARRWGASRSVGMALRAVGNAEPERQGVRTLREAVSTLERSHARLELAMALADLGAALRRSGERREAREQLRRGLDLAHQLGALAVAQRAREELVVAGGRPRRDALRGRDALTAGELRVARLAAAGQTNRQIAQALFVTLRTVEHHLTNVYGKLGIRSRAELAEALEPGAQ